jgi:hypothetical protein
MGRPPVSFSVQPQMAIYAVVLTSVCAFGKYGTIRNELYNKELEQKTDG